MTMEYEDDEEGGESLLGAEVVDVAQAVAAAGIKDLGRRARLPGQKGPGVEVMDPEYLFSDKDRYMHLDRMLRLVQTATPLLQLYGFMQLGSNDVNGAIPRKTLRRLVQVHLPKFVLEEMLPGKRFLQRVTHPSLAQNAVPFQDIYGEHNESATAPNSGNLPPEFKDNELVIEQVDQRWWVHAGAANERFGRKDTGFYQMRWADVAARAKAELRAKLGARMRCLAGHLNPQERFDAILAINEARSETAKEYFQHRRGWEALKRHERTKLPDDRLIEFNTSERFAHMYKTMALIEKLPESRDWRDSLFPEQDLIQSIVETVDAEEELLDMISTVLRKPLLQIQETEVKRYLVIILHTELMVFISEDELNAIRKIVDHRKQWLGSRRAEALALLAEAKITSAPDNWMFGSAGDQSLRDLTYPFIDPAIHLGYIWEKALRWAARTGQDPYDYRIRPGPETAGWHLREMRRVVNQFNALLDLIDLTSHRPEDTDEEILRGAEGGFISDRDLKSGWKDLIQFPKEKVVWTYWDTTEEGWPNRPHLTPAPGREPHAAPYWDVALWYDWNWVMRNDHYIFPQLVEYMNQRLREAGFVNERGELTVEVTADGPDSNYFRGKDLAHELHRHQPVEPIIKRLKWVWNREVAKGTTHIRPVYYREVLAELPRELLANLPTPNREYIKPLRDATSAGIAVATDPEEKRQLGKNLTLLNRCLKRDTNDLDEFTKFVQKLNRDSDARVRMWAGFESHSTAGSVMAFEPPEAIGYIKEGYGTDTGGPYEDLQATAVDLVVFAWTNHQFNKALYLARGLSYLITAKVDPLRRHESVGSAISGGLHWAIANHVVEGFKGLDYNLRLTSESKAAKWVQRIFEQKEIQQLGRRVVKELLEKELLRKEMRLQIVT